MVEMPLGANGRKDGPTGRAGMRRRLWIVLVPMLFTAACSTDPDPATSPEPSNANFGTATPTTTTTTTTTPATNSTPAAGTGEDFFLSFDGIDDRVLVPWDQSFPTEVFTAAAWIRLPDPPARRSAIIARGEDNDSYNLSWQLFIANDGKLQVMLEATNEDNYCYPGNNCVPQGECTSGDTFVADGHWHHVAVTRDATGTLVFYIDAEERARCRDTGVPSSDNHQFLSLGATHGVIGPPPDGIEPATWFFDGDIDDDAMWNVSLSATEIAAVVADGIDLSVPGLVGHWTFDDGTGQKVADHSPAQNDGFLGADQAADSADPTWAQ